MLLVLPLLPWVHETRVVTRFRASLVFWLRLFNLFFLGLVTDVVAVIVVVAVVAV